MGNTRCENIRAFIVAVLPWRATKQILQHTFPGLIVCALGLWPPSYTHLDVCEGPCCFPRCLFAQCWVIQSAFKATNNCDRDSNATLRADAGKCVMARVPLRLKEGLPHWRGGDSLNKTPHAQFPLPRTHTRHRTRSELRGSGSPACCVTAVLTSSLLCLSLGRL